MSMQRVMTKESDKLIPEGFLNVLKTLGLSRKFDDSYLEVVDILTRLRETANEVSVCFQEESSTYQGKISAFNPLYRIMVVDVPVPPEEYSSKSGKPVTITTEQHGREIVLQSKFLEPLLPDFSAGYQFSIPRALGTEQPRGAFRFMLDEIRQRVQISLKGVANETVKGVARNISRSGVGFKTGPGWSSFCERNLSNENQGIDCEIALDQASKISCKMDIRNLHNTASGESGTYVGGRFLDISRKDGAVLYSFINQLQRKHLLAITS